MTLISVPVFGMLKPWQLAFVIVGLPGVFIGLLVLLTVKDPKRKGQKVDANGQVAKVSLKDTFAFLGKHRKTFTCHYLGFTFYAMALYCIISWAPAFYIRKFGLTPTEAGYIPDCGAMAALISASTGVVPKVIGKPNREIIDAMFRKKPVSRAQVAMVGDRLYTDIVMGHNAGVKSILVLSGEARREDIAASPVKPDYIFDGLGALYEELRRADAARTNS